MLQCGLLRFAVKLGFEGFRETFGGLVRDHGCVDFVPRFARGTRDETRRAPKYAGELWAIGKELFSRRVDSGSVRVVTDLRDLVIILESF